MGAPLYGVNWRSEEGAGRVRWEDMCELWREGQQLTIFDSTVVELFFVMMVGGSEIILHKKGYKDSDPSNFPRAR